MVDNSIVWERSDRKHQLTHQSATKASSDELSSSFLAGCQRIAFFVHADLFDSHKKTSLIVA
jgi:hypothetical protein